MFKEGLSEERVTPDRVATALAVRFRNLSGCRIIAAIYEKVLKWCSMALTGCPRGIITASQRSSVHFNDAQDVATARAQSSHDTNSALLALKSFVTAY